MQKEAIKKYYIQLLLYAFINASFALGIWGIVQTGSSIISLIGGSVLCIFYCLYFISLNYFKKFYNFLFNMLFMSFVLTMTYRRAIGINAVGWLNFENVLLLIFLIQLLISDKYRKIMRKDIIVKIWVFFVFVFSFVSIFNGNNLWNILAVAFIYLRALPLYVVIAYHDYELDQRDLSFFIIINAAVIPLEIFTGFSVDDIGGLYGIYGCTPLSIFIVFFFGLLVGAYVSGKIGVFKFLVGNVFFYGLCILAEIKIAVFLCPVLEFILVLIQIRKKDKLRKIINKFVTAAVVPVTFLVAYSLMLAFNPKWINRINRAGGALNYFMYYSRQAKVLTQFSKLEVHEYLFENLLNGIIGKIFGNGIGSAMPSEFCQFELRDWNLKRNFEYFSFYRTKFYVEYSYRLGYHATASGVTLIETGILGLFMFVMPFFVILYRSWKLICSENENLCMMGSGGLMFIIYLFPMFVYYNIIVRIQIITTVMIVFGLITRYYRKELSKNKKEL